MKNEINKHGQKILEAGKFSFSSKRRILLTTSLSVFLLLFLVLSSFPGYSIQMLGANPAYLGEVFTALTLNLYGTAGYLGLITVTVYSLLTSIALVNTVSLIRFGEGGFSFKSLGGALPSFVIGSCAGCGAGILGFLGFTGALALLPFSGNGVRILGIGFLIYFLRVSGSPEKCNL